MLFLTLSAFSATGGIEKVCRVAAQAFYALNANEQNFQLYSMHDAANCETSPYLPKKNFRGFAGKKIMFVVTAALAGRSAGTVVISHINLLPVAYLIKKIAPSTQIILMAHGIEVWEPLKGLKKQMLGCIDRVAAVSQFTKEKMQTALGLPAEKISVINNCLDPYMPEKASTTAVENIRQQFGLEKSDQVLLTLTRLKTAEQYKGYDQVIRSLPAVLNQLPDLKYIIAGKHDAAEKRRLDELVQLLQLQNRVVFTGFVAEANVAALFGLCDVYVMPSRGEGFGIVFIEALNYGRPVIAGNADGSVDALAGGKFGLLVDPTDVAAISNAILSAFQQPVLPPIEAVAEKFGYNAYKNKWARLLHPRQVKLSPAAQQLKAIN